jgi:hypothetical protein
LIWGAQLVQGASAGDYKATYAAAAAVGYTDIYGQPFAQKLVENTANGAHVMQVNVSGLVSGTSYVASVYAKAGERTKFDILAGAGTGTGSTVFDLVAVTATGGGTITDVGNGWYRCSVTIIPNSGLVQYLLRLYNGATASYPGDGTSGIFIFGAQLSDSASVDPYVYQPVAAPTSTAYFGPRFDYDPVTLAPKGLLIEEQRTNLLLRSQDFSTTWFRLATTVTANALVSPDGALDADKLVEDTSNGQHLIGQSSGTQAAGAFTFSFYVKAGERSRGECTVGNSVGGGNGFYASFNLNTQTATLLGQFGTGFTGTSASLTSVGNGWFRFQLSGTTSASSNVAAQINMYNNAGSISYTGDGTSGMFLWGAQLEAGTFATSYIPTVASQVTRAADNASMIGNNFARWYNQTAGTALVKYDFSALGSRTALEFSDGTVNNRMRYASDITYTGTQVVTGGVTQATLIPAISVANTPYALSGSYANNSFIAVETGDIADVDTSGTVPITSLVRLGNDISNNYLNGHVAGFAYYPRALAASEQTSLVNGVYTISIASLFANGEQGWWYDPSNFATLFQDSAGTTPVTAMEQPVGLQLDLSKGLVLGPELVSNPGPGFTTSTGWTAQTGGVSTVSGGNLTLTTTITSYATIPITTVIGKSYLLSTNIVSAFTSGGFYAVRKSDDLAVNVNIVTAKSNSTGVGQCVFTATATTSYIVLQNNGAGQITVAYASVKELPGNHRFQSTSANRPVVSARVNLLTKTEQFDDAAWVKSSGSITATNVAAPDGTLTAEVFTPTAQFAFVLQNLSTSITTGSATVSVWLRTQSGTRDLSLRGTATALLYLTPITVTTTWTQFSATYAYNGTNPIDQFLVQDRNASGFVPIEIWGADLRVTNQGVGLPAYQRVNTSTDYDSTGFPIYIKPNGSNQFMQTNSINFTATNKMTVWQGVRKLSDAARGTIVEFGTSLSSNGVFAIAGPDAGAATTFAFDLRGNVNAYTVPTPYPAPITIVGTGLFDIGGATVGDQINSRINGVLNNTGRAGSAGTGNFGNWPAYFYMRAGTSLPFNGNDYGSIARGAASTAGQITAGETYINTLTKAY